MSLRLENIKYSMDPGLQTCWERGKSWPADTENGPVQVKNCKTKLSYDVYNVYIIRNVIVFLFFSTGDMYIKYVEDKTMAHFAGGKNAPTFFD